MSKRNQQTFLKRQREQKKAEKAAQKRARRDGLTDPSLESPADPQEPPTVADDEPAAAKPDDVPA